MTSGRLRHATGLHATLWTLAFATVLAAPARADDRASGDWGGLRTRLEDRGIDIRLDYTAEVFTRDTSDIAYRGNTDLTVELDTEKAGLWKGGDVLVYGQDGHGDNISAKPGFAMNVSNYEASSFTQLSEFWLLQQLPLGIQLRLGKQDANRDFAAPHFSGNFMNSSFGVLPTSPLPSYPAPALGVAAFVPVTQWLELRGGAYEGNPKVESFGRHAFDGSAFEAGALQFHKGHEDARDWNIQVGGWHSSESDRSGAFGVADTLYRVGSAGSAGHRSFQLFVRGNWEPKADAPDARLYVGGGATAHGFAGENNTFGVGAGFVSIPNADQGFVELFFKWRPRAWFTVEPDFQVYFLEGNAYVIGALRLKLKL